MKADLSRNSFAPNKKFNSVRQQQGRVLTDADWNEQSDIAQDRDRRFSVDVLNSDGAPVDAGGFALQVVDDGGQDNLQVSAGRYYVNGILTENEVDVLFTAQPDLPGATLPTEDGVYLAYLDAWERGIDHLDDALIREEALNGADTADRTQTVAQTKLLKIGESGLVVPPASPPVAWTDLTERSLPGLTARALASGAPDTSCDGGGYTGIDNALYRIEIHQSGAPGAATFKWSRSNAGLAHEWESLDGDELTVRALLQNSIAPALKAGDWIELTDAGLELENRRGTLVRLEQVDARVLRIDPATAIHYDPAITTLDLADFSRGVRKIRPWDMRGAAGEIPVPAAGWVEVEAGVEIRFDSAEYQSGDYWLIPARSTSRSLLWPCEDGVGPVSRSAEGVRHDYAQLAFLEKTGGDWTLLRDCRRRFASRTNAQLLYISGSGQEAMPGQSLAAPIEVRAVRGDRPVLDARIQFEIIAGGGALSHAGPPIASGATLIVAADADGVAAVDWQLDTLTPAQKVRATLLDAVSTGLPATIDFVANQSIAQRVAYDTVTGGDSTQDVLDRLGSEKINRAGDTVTGSLVVQQNLEVKGTLNAQGDVLANAQNVAGDIQLGNQEDDRVRVFGEIDSAHSSGMLEVADDLLVREDLIVDGKVGVNTPTNDAILSVGGAIEARSGGFRFPDGTLQTTAGGASDSVPPGLSVLGESATPPAGFVYTGTRIATENSNGFRTWTARRDLPATRADQVVEVVDGQIYMIGGSTIGIGSYTNATYRYDPIANLWSPPLATMGFSRGGAASAVIDGKIHVVGGQLNFTAITNAHEVYDPITDLWSTLTGPALQRSFARAASVDGKLYLFGGDIGGTVSSTVQVYDPQTDSWDDSLAPMGVARRVAGIAVYEGLIYVLGGISPTDTLLSVEVYDPAMNTWTPLAGMPAPKYGFGTSVIDGKIVTYGGQNQAGTDLRTVEIYDIKTNRWETLEDMPEAKRAAGWATVDGTAYIFGGAIGSTWFDTAYARAFPVSYYLHAKSPFPGDGGRLRVLGTDWSHANIAWTKAENAAGPASALDYRVYYSSEDNIGSVADIDANGTSAGDAQADIDRLSVTGLANGQTYYINVLVEDISGNRAAYTPTKVEIPYEWQLLDGGNVNGINVNGGADALRPNVSAYFKQIAATWEEPTSSGVRVRSFDGLAWNPLETGGINASGTVEQPVAAFYRGRLFVARIEFVPGWRIRVSAYDGDRWYSVDNGALNLTGNNAFGPVFAVHNDRLYLGYYEDNPGTNRFQIRMMRYEGGITWRQVDGDGTFASLNYSPANGASLAGVAGWRNRLFVAWTEAQGPEQIRVRALSEGGSWTFVDGGGSTGLNFDPTIAAFGGRLVVYRDALYCSFYEARAGIGQIRVKRYDIDANGERWTFVDGGLSTGLNFDVGRSAVLEGMTVADDLLFVSWSEANAGGVSQARVKAFDGESWRFVDGAGANGLNASVARNIEYPRISGVNDRAVLPFVENVAGSRKIRVREAGYDEAPLSSPIDSARAVAYNGKIYLAGLRAPASVMQQYDPVARTWKRLTPAPVGRENAVMGASDGRIYLLGGGTAGGVDTVANDIYDIATDTWSVGSPIPGTVGQWTGGLIGTKIYVFGFFNGTLHIYDIPTDDWSFGASFPAATSQMSAVVLNDRLYVIGGWNGSANVATTHEYDPATDAWTPLASMSVARGRVGLAAANGKIYAIGGQAGGSNVAQNTFEEYDPLTNSWRTLNQLENALTATAAVGLGDRVYWIGGGFTADDTQNQRSVHSRELRQDWWNARPLPEEYGASPVVVLDGKVHFLGSYRESSAFITTHTVFDPATESYSTLADVPEALQYAFAAAIDGKIYMVGGSDSAATPNTDTHIYDPATNTWSTGAPLPDGDVITVGGVINGKIYLVGATDRLLHEYDPVGDAWAALSQSPREHTNGMAAVINNQLYLMGGVASGSSVHVLETDVYDPDTDDWTLAAPIPDGRYGAGAVAHAGEIYLLGGYDGPVGVNRRVSCLKLDLIRGDWVNIPPLTDEHAYFQPVVVNDIIYAAGGRVATQNAVSRRVEKLSLNDLAPYAPVPTSLPFFNDWTLRADMPVAQAEPMAAAVNGRFYLFGGQATQGASVTFNDDSFVYDPITDAWNTIAPITTPRGNGVAAHVNGKIYVMTGAINGGASDLNEEYDPLNDSWTTRAPVPTARYNTGVAVLDGLIYLIGAQQPADGMKVDAYDPVADSWTNVATVPTPRASPMCAAFDGKIYVIGGALSNTSVNTGVVEIFDPAGPGWTTGATMPTARSSAAISVVGGLIVVAGGYDGANDLATVEAYDPVNDVWATLESMSQARAGIESLVSGRTMFAFGGVLVGSLQYFARTEAISIPEAQTLAPLPDAVAAAVTETIDGKIYTGLGVRSLPNTMTGDLNVYDPASDSWAALAAGTARAGAAGAVLNGKLYTFGGATDTSVYSTLNEVYDPETDEWTTLAPLTTAARDSAACAGPDGRLYLFGGLDGPDLTTAEAYDVFADSWTALTPLPSARAQARAVRLGGRIHLIGGQFSGSALANHDVYDPATNQWSSLAALPVPFTNGAATVRNGRIYYFAGVNPPNLNGAIYEYDPFTNAWKIVGLLDQNVYSTAAVTVGTRVYFHGGFDESDTTRSENQVVIFEN
ncbi:MAG: DUF6519 domain-containing protein [bacterium]|nr:DUF6519 domain-containing protein [bacterium]